MSNPLRHKKIGVVGPGAVGGYYGGMLAHVGYPVHFLLRSDLEAVRRDGLTIRTRGKELRFPVAAHGSPQEMGACDLVIISLKATANAALEELIPPLLHAGTQLITLQNGLGNEDFLAQRWGAERVLGALCFVCLNRVEPGVIEHFDHGSISLGDWQRSPGDTVQHLAAALQEAGIQAQVVENLATERWRKLLWNIPFNGLSIAANGATVDRVLADEGLRTEARALMEEVLMAARALGHQIPTEFADFQIERSWSMGAYKPSSMIDWQLGRPVEVEAIWGEPFRQGTAAGVAMPKLALLYRLLQHLTRAST